MSIQIRNVSKQFGQFQALDDVSLEVEGGSLTALLGPSGSGKSTLLRIVAGLEWPDLGEILISGQDATALAPQKRGVGFVFQHYAAFKHMTVRDNVAFGLRVRKRPRAEIRERVDELLRARSAARVRAPLPRPALGWAASAHGVGPRPRPEPRVLLLDEPFGALDARVRAELRDWLRRLHDEVHVTTVFVTHDQEEAMEVADQIAVLEHGRLQQVGSPRELYDEPATEFVMRFVGDASSLDGDLVRPHDIELATRLPTVRSRRWSSASHCSASWPRSSSSTDDRGLVTALDDPRSGRRARARAGPDRVGARRRCASRRRA